MILGALTNYFSERDLRKRRNKIFLKQDELEQEIAKLEEQKHILDKKIIDRYENRIINIHPSLIPKYCGKGYYGIKVHEQVIANKEKVSGVTVHYVDNGIDTGEIIIQEHLQVNEDDTAQTLQKRILEIEHKILPKAINIVIEKLKF